MESNNVSRAPPAEYRPTSAGPVGQEPQLISQPPIRPPLNRADSRSNIQPLQRPPVQGLSQPQARPQFQSGGPVNAQPQFQPGGPVTAQPQFQPGGPVTAQPQFVPRPGTPVPRAVAPGGPVGQQQYRAPPPQLRQAGPQSFAPSLGPRPQHPGATQPPQRLPPPNNLQFGPRQTPQSVTTPEGTRPPVGLPPNGTLRTGAPLGPAQVPTVQATKPFVHGLSRGPDFNTNLPKSGNLENQNNSSDIQNVKTENGIEVPEVTKGRSYSIASAPGAPSPLKMEDDRRKSVSSIGGKTEEYNIRSPGLGLIQEGKADSKDNVRGSRESVRSEISNDGNRDVPERPESRLSGSKMTESFIGSLPTAALKKKQDDDDDVILHNANKNTASSVKDFNKGLADRSPSLSRSDESPEPIKQSVPTPSIITKPTSEPPEPQLVRMQKSEPIRQDIKNDFKTNYMQQKVPSKSPVMDSKPPPMPQPKKPSDLNTNTNPPKSTPRKSPSATKTRQKDGDNDSGVDESTQGNDLNGSPGSPNKKAASKLPTKEKSNGSFKTSLSRSSSKSATAKTPENPPPVSEKKKVPMNKVQVGNAPSPNIKAVKSKIGSLENATYKPGGGKVKIENRKVELANVTPRIAAKNDAYVPSGGSKKILSTKLEWNAKSKIGSLQNTSYKPGGGDKKIETVKLDFKDKAKPKVASTVNITHKPGGGTVKIENQKLEFKAQSKVGSLDNVKHKPGGGVVKIFDDKDYIKQMSGASPVPTSRSHSRQESPTPLSQPPKSDENLNQQV